MLGHKHMKKLILFTMISLVFSGCSRKISVKEFDYSLFVKYEDVYGSLPMAIYKNDDLIWGDDIGRETLINFKCDNNTDKFKVAFYKRTGSTMEDKISFSLHPDGFIVIDIKKDLTYTKNEFETVSYKKIHFK